MAYSSAYGLAQHSSAFGLAHIITVALASAVMYQYMILKSRLVEVPPIMTTMSYF